MSVQTETVTVKQISLVDSKAVKRQKMLKSALKNYQLYLFILPSLVYIIVFCYWPMYGVQMAFRNFVPSKGIWGSTWVGLDHLVRFFGSYYFERTMGNTIYIALYSLIAGFPFPILLALMLNEVKNQRYKKIVQTVTYAPNFISTIVMVGMLYIFLDPSSGMINTLIKAIGIEPLQFMSRPELFTHVYVWSGIWQSTGFASVIYFAALSSVDLELHEAATIDGANRIQRMWYINVPVLIPIATILLILSAGSIMSVSFEKTFLMQNTLNLEASEVIATYVYKVGLLNAEYSFSSAVGLFNSVINAIMLILVNTFARKLSDTSLW